MILSTLSLESFEIYILVCKFYDAFLPNLFRPNLNFTAGNKIGISSKKLHTRKYF